MSLATNLNPFLNFQLAGPAIKGTQPLIITRPSTPLPSDPADTDLTSSLSSVPADLGASPNDENLFSSTEVEQLWDRVLQTSLTEDNGSLHASDYPVVQAVSPYYIKFPTHPCAWFIVEPGHVGRAYPSDVTKLKSGAVLRFKDRTISINMLTEERLTHYICLTKPIRRDQGYVIYELTSDLFSRFHTPQPEKPPTNLVAIPEFHADDEAAHLTTQEATFHQRVLEKDYAIAPLCTWDRDPFSTTPLKNMTWHNREDEPEVRVDWFMSSEDDIREEVVRILREKESKSG
jgi:hypothetical protein